MGACVHVFVNALQAICLILKACFFNLASSLHMCACMYVCMYVCLKLFAYQNKKVLMRNWMAKLLQLGELAVARTKKTNLYDIICMHWNLATLSEIQRKSMLAFSERGKSKAFVPNIDQNRNSRRS